MLGNLGSFSVIRDHLGDICGLFGAIWGHFGIIWDHLGVIWTRLGVIWGHFGLIWESFGGLFEVIWGHWGSFWPTFGPRVKFAKIRGGQNLHFGGFGGAILAPFWIDFDSFEQKSDF